jgi:hypothetical protein
MLPEVEPQSYEVTVTGRYIFDSFPALSPHRRPESNICADPHFLQCVSGSSIFYRSAEEKHLGQFSNNYRTFYPKKLSLISQKYGFGIRDPRSGILDPGSGIRKKPVPNPGPGSATLYFMYQKHILCTLNCSVVEQKIYLSALRCITLQGTEAV